LLFIISEIMLFGAFFAAYFFIRVVSADQWPPGDGLPVAVAATNAAILLSSSVTMHWTDLSAKRGNQAGMRMLLSRRLVESGVRFVTMTYGGWDMHDNIAGSMKGQLPAFDQGFASLIRDLDRTGLLATTLVCVCSEFGRTPKINATAGRDHWPKVFSVVMAGGGLKQGIVYGSSNATASEPEDDPLTVEDWATTIYDRLGIVADKELMAPGDRPIEIVDGGKVRKELIA
jgi:hypothetical protein